MVVELIGVQLIWSETGVWNHARDFKIGLARGASSSWNDKYYFRPKLHDTKFNYHLITAILKSQNSLSTNILLI